MMETEMNVESQFSSLDEAKLEVGGSDALFAVV